MMRGKSKKLKFEEVHPDNIDLLQCAVYIIHQQLPNMPTEYVQILICQKSLNYNTLLVQLQHAKKNKDHQTVGCITYRLYPQWNFAELAFCCISTQHQGKGYGSQCMQEFVSKLKQYDIQYAITYADNDAVHFFEKQGFEMGPPHLNREVWYPRIYHYQGGCIMSVDTTKVDAKLQYKSKNNKNSNLKNKMRFQSCFDTNSFQSKYAINSPPKIVTNINLNSAEYRGLSPTSRMTPSANWRATLSVKRGRKRKKISSPSCESTANKIKSPPRKKRKANNLQMAQIMDTIEKRERYEISEIEQYDPNKTHYHATRLSQKLHLQNHCVAKLTIKLKYKHCGNKYRLPSFIWEGVTGFIERECLNNTNMDDIIFTVCKIWKLKIKSIKSIVKELNANRQVLYYPLGTKLRKNTCFILPLNCTEIGWDIQIFKFQFIDGFGNLWGHNFKQLSSKTIKGEPNLFDSFYLSTKKTAIKHKENMLMFSKVFRVQQDDNILLPWHILQELYIRNYPQLRYCFKTSNPLFRKFIYSFKH